MSMNGDSKTTTGYGHVVYSDFPPDIYSRLSALSHSNLVHSESHADLFADSRSHTDLFIDSGSDSNGAEDDAVEYGEWTHRQSMEVGNSHHDSLHPNQTDHFTNNAAIKPSASDYQFDVQQSKSLNRMTTLERKKRNKPKTFKKRVSTFFRGFNSTSRLALDAHQDNTAITSYSKNSSHTRLITEPAVSSIHTNTASKHSDDTESTRRETSLGSDPSSTVASVKSHTPSTRLDPISSSASPSKLNLYNTSLTRSASHSSSTIRAANKFKLNLGFGKSSKASKSLKELAALNSATQMQQHLLLQKVPLHHDDTESNHQDVSNTQRASDSVDRRLTPSHKLRRHVSDSSLASSAAISLVCLDDPSLDLQEEKPFRPLQQRILDLLQAEHDPDSDADFPDDSETVIDNELHNTLHRNPLSELPQDSQNDSTPMHYKQGHPTYTGRVGNDSGGRGIQRSRQSNYDLPFLGIIEAEKFARPDSRSTNKSAGPSRALEEINNVMDDVEAFVQELDPTFHILSDHVTLSRIQARQLSAVPQTGVSEPKMHNLPSNHSTDKASDFVSKVVPETMATSPSLQTLSHTLVTPTPSFGAKSNTDLILGKFPEPLVSKHADSQSSKHAFRPNTSKAVYTGDEVSNISHFESASTESPATSTVMSNIELTYKEKIHALDDTFPHSKETIDIGAITSTSTVVVAPIQNNALNKIAEPYDQHDVNSPTYSNEEPSSTTPLVVQMRRRYSQTSLFTLGDKPEMVHMSPKRGPSLVGPFSASRQGSSNLSILSSPLDHDGLDTNTSATSIELFEEKHDTDEQVLQQTTAPVVQTPTLSFPTTRLRPTWFSVTAGSKFVNSSGQNNDKSLVSSAPESDLDALRLQTRLRQRVLEHVNAGPNSSVVPKAATASEHVGIIEPVTSSVTLTDMGNASHEALSASTLNSILSTASTSAVASITPLVLTPVVTSNINTASTDNMHVLISPSVDDEFAADCDHSSVIVSDTHDRVFDEFTSIPPTDTVLPKSYATLTRSNDPFDQHISPFDTIQTPDDVVRPSYMDIPHTGAEYSTDLDHDTQSMLDDHSIDYIGSPLSVSKATQFAQLNFTDVDTDPIPPTRSSSIHSSSLGRKPGVNILRRIHQRQQDFKPDLPLDCDQVQNIHDETSLISHKPIETFSQTSSVSQSIPMIQLGRSNSDAVVYKLKQQQSEMHQQFTYENTQKQLLDPPPLDTSDIHDMSRQSQECVSLVQVEPNMNPMSFKANSFRSVSALDIMDTEIYSTDKAGHSVECVLSEQKHTRGKNSNDAVKFFERLRVRFFNKHDNRNKEKAIVQQVIDESVVVSPSIINVSPALDVVTPPQLTHHSNASMSEQTISLIRRLSRKLSKKRKHKEQLLHSEMEANKSIGGAAHQDSTHVSNNTTGVVPNMESVSNFANLECEPSNGAGSIEGVKQDNLIKIPFVRQNSMGSTNATVESNVAESLKSRKSAKIVVETDEIAIETNDKPHPSSAPLFLEDTKSGISFKKTTYFNRSSLPIIALHDNDGNTSPTKETGLSTRLALKTTPSLSIITQELHSYQPISGGDSNILPTNTRHATTDASKDVNEMHAAATFSTLPTSATVSTPTPTIAITQSPNTPKQSTSATTPSETKLGGFFGKIQRKLAKGLARGERNSESIKGSRSVFDFHQLKGSSPITHHYAGKDTFYNSASTNPKRSSCEPSISPGPLSAGGVSASSGSSIKSITTKKRFGIFGFGRKAMTGETQSPATPTRNQSMWTFGNLSPTPIESEHDVRDDLPSNTSCDIRGKSIPENDDNVHQENKQKVLKKIALPLIESSHFSMDLEKLGVDGWIGSALDHHSPSHTTLVTESNRQSISSPKQDMSNMEVKLMPNGDQSMDSLLTNIVTDKEASKEELIAVNETNLDFIKT
ncbi:hypothetical protein MT418_007287 [Batrachochytrium dendrobatidis]